MMLFKKIIDLTYTLNSSSPNWEGNCGFSPKFLADYSEHGCRVHEYTMRGGIGTHIDAPTHFIPGSLDIASLPLESLIAPAHVIKVANKAHCDYRVTPEDIIDYENKHGAIATNSLVVFYTGWDKYWEAPKKYRNNLSFPSIHEETAQLVVERDIAGLGTDTLSADARGQDFPVHRVILGAGKYLVENVAHAKELPPTGARVYIMPMKMKDATEAPIRLIAHI